MIARLRKLWRLLLEAEDRLRSLEARVAGLGTQSASLLGLAPAIEAAARALKAGAEALEARSKALEARMVALEGGTAAAREALAIELDGIRRGVRHLTEQLDLLKSSLELDAHLIGDFQRWKALNPVPARPLVSVCVATFDRHETLTGRCLPSVFAQTYANVEVIVVGDACTDGTVEAVGRIDDSRLRFVNLPERGAYPEDPARRWMVAGTAAMNKALSLVQGDYVTHLDDDDEYLPDRIEKLVAFALSKGCDLVWHPFWCEDEEGRWGVNEAEAFAWTRVTTGSVLYRSWFTRILWDPDAHRLLEPGDWNRFRRMKYVGPVAMRCPEPLLRHYREKTRDP